MIAVGLMIALVAASPSHANLIGVVPNATSSPVYNIDTTTGALTLIGNSGIPQLQDLALSPDGIYYASAGLTGNQQLVTINPTTGAGTVVGPIAPGGGLQFMNGLAFGNDGTLYGTGTPPGGTSSNLYRIDRTTGATTLIGSTNAPGVNALDVSANGTLYGWSTNPGPIGLRTINTTTGTSTLLGPAGGGQQLFQDIVFTPDGTLWGIHPTGFELYTIDPATGETTFKFGGLQNFRGLENLAPVPVPAAIWLFGSGLAAMVGYARRKMA